MTLALHYHPLASFCHKVQMALYENGTPFEGHIVDFSDPAGTSAFLDMWPVGKIPVLRDEARQRTVPETSIIIEYLEQHYPSPVPLFPENPDERLQARLWDRFYDLYVNVPMQKIVTDNLRPEGRRDPHGVADAEQTLRTAYDMIERQMADKTWVIGESFSIADCAAAPALFYADIVVPFSASHKKVAAYFGRLERRQSFERVLVEARPYFRFFPLQHLIPPRFLGDV